MNVGFLELKSEFSLMTIDDNLDVDALEHPDLTNKAFGTFFNFGNKTAASTGACAVMA